MIPLVLSKAVREKLDKKHNVQEQEVRECFLNHDGKYLYDTREDHLTDPPTLWFVSETYRGRLLKIIFICRDGNIYLKSAYEADDKAICTYNETVESGE